MPWRCVEICLTCLCITDSAVIYRERLITDTGVCCLVLTSSSTKEVSYCTSVLLLRKLHNYIWSKKAVTCLTVFCITLETNVHFRPLLMYTCISQCILLIAMAFPDCFLCHYIPPCNYPPFIFFSLPPFSFFPLSFLFITSLILFPLCHFLLITSLFFYWHCHFLLITSLSFSLHCHILLITSLFFSLHCHFLFITSLFFSLHCHILFTSLFFSFLSFSFHYLPLIMILLLFYLIRNKFRGRRVCQPRIQPTEICRRMHVQDHTVRTGTARQMCRISRGKIP